MDDCDASRWLGQVSSKEAGDVFQDFLRGLMIARACAATRRLVAHLLSPTHAHQRPANLDQSYDAARPV